VSNISVSLARLRGALSRVRIRGMSGRGLSEVKRKIDIGTILLLMLPVVVVVLVVIYVKIHPYGRPVTAKFYVPFTIEISLPPSLFDFKLVMMLVAVCTALTAPVAIREYRHYMLVCKIEEQLPTIVRMISSTLRTGGTLDKAIELIASSPIRPSNMVFARAIALSRLSAIPLVEAIRRVGLELRAQSLIRLADILELAVRYGAHLEETLDVTARVLESLESFRKERQTHVKPYVIVVYIIVLVYVMLYDAAVAIALSGFGAGAGPIGTAVRIAASEVSPNVLTSTCIYTLVIQLFTASLIIGKILYDRAKCGLIHFVILAPLSAILTYILLGIFKAIIATGPLATSLK